MIKTISKLLLSACLSLVVITAAGQGGEDGIGTGKGKEKEDAINTNKKTPLKIIEYVVGTWQVEDVMNGKKDISETDTVSLANTFVFDRENRFLSYSGDERIDSGRFRVNETQGILYLESDGGGPPSEWNLTFQDRDQMTLQEREQSSAARSLKYVYTRKAGN
jgi:hypothetical protein